MVRGRVLRLLRLDMFRMRNHPDSVSLQNGASWNSRKLTWWGRRRGRRRNRVKSHMSVRRVSNSSDCSKSMTKTKTKKTPFKVLTLLTFPNLGRYLATRQTLSYGYWEKAFSKGYLQTHQRGVGKNLLSCSPTDPISDLVHICLQVVHSCFFTIVCVFVYFMSNPISHSRFLVQGEYERVGLAWTK